MLHLVRNSGPARDENLEGASHGGHENGPKGVTIIRVGLPCGELSLSGTAVHEFPYGILYHLDQDERDREEKFRAVLPEGMLEVGRDRRHVQHDKVHSAAQRSNHVECEPENMGIREDTDETVSLPVGKMRREHVHVGAEVPDSEHYTFRESGRAGGVHYPAEVFHGTLRIVHVLRFQSVRMCLGEPGFTGLIDV